MIELKGVLKIAVGGLFICTFTLALMYPVISTSHEDKIHFLLSPKAVAIFYPPLDIDVDWMFVSAAVFKDSSFGSFKTVVVGYESYDFDSNWNVIKIWDQLHFYTDNRRAGEIWAQLYEIEYPTWDGIPTEWEYDITLARIDMTISEHELDATIIVKGKTLFTVNFEADSSAEIQSRIEPGSPLPQELFLSVEALRPMLTASVTGLEVGAYRNGRFTYIDAELIDSSLLP